MNPIYIIGGPHNKVFQEFKESLLPWKFLSEVGLAQNFSPLEMKMRAHLFDVSKSNHATKT